MQNNSEIYLTQCEIFNNLSYFGFNIVIFQINGSVTGLLPDNVSLAEMVESQTKQMEWYAHLMDTAGAEAASK